MIKKSNLITVNSVDLIIFSTEFTVQRILPQNDKTEKTFGFRGLRNPVFLMAIKNLFLDSRGLRNMILLRLIDEKLKTAKYISGNPLGLL